MKGLAATLHASLIGYIFCTAFCNSEYTAKLSDFFTFTNFLFQFLYPVLYFSKYVILYQYMYTAGAGIEPASVELELFRMPICTFDQY